MSLTKEELNEKVYCEKCHKAKARKEFYQSDNFVKYPNKGTIPICKECATMHIDNWDAETFKWLLEAIDVPYVPSQWNKLLRKYGQDPRTVTGKTIIGRYLAAMRLKQYKGYKWKDSEFLQELEAKEIRETMEFEKREMSEIAQAIEENNQIMTKPDLSWDPNIVAAGAGPVNLIESGTPVSVESSAASENVVSITGEQQKTPEELGLTEDDVKYLEHKFGKGYTYEQLIKMELFCSDFEDSYDIQTAGHKDNLIKLAKVSLRLDELMVIGDFENMQKAQKMYDMLMKTGNFTAQQNREIIGDSLDSVSKITALCETDGFIPKYYVDSPQDKIDWTIKDMQSYTKNLVEEETNLTELVQTAVKMLAEDKAKESDETTDEDDGSTGLSEEEIEAMFAEDNRELTTEDYEEFSDFQDSLEEGVDM